MFTNEHALVQLLPSYIRSRDANSGNELEQLVAVIGGQAAALERDLERMYDGWFIETCDDWLIPYLADVVGLEPAHVSTVENAERRRRLTQVLSARSATANAIAHRRRKGTLWILEELARDVAHWPARSVEFHRQVVVASHLDHLYATRAALADVRSAHALSQLSGPVDGFCHLTDVRRISNADSRGQYAVQNVGLFVWRLRPYPVTRTTAYCREEAGKHCFTFSALGQDTQLFRAPSPETTRTSTARAEHLPTEITRMMLERDAPPGAEKAEADPALYGPTASLVVETPDWPARGQKGATSASDPLIAAARIIPADLSDWSYKVPKGHIAIDPVLGRIAFPLSQAPRREVKVTYRYGFAADIGGGEYSRPAAPLPPIFERVPIWADGQPGTGKVVTIASELAAWRKRSPRAGKPKAAAKSLDAAADTVRQPERALVIELMTSGIYEGRFDLTLEESETVAIVAAPGARPVLWLSDESAGSADSITIRGRRGSRMILDGLLVAGRGIEVGDALDETTRGGQQEMVGSDGLCEVWIRHSTLVPGGSLSPNCDPRRPSEPSLILDDTSACTRIEASIVGAIRVLHERGTHEPTPLSIADSIIDATSEDRFAIGGESGQVAFAEITILRSTVVGRVAAHAVRAAEDSIFASRLEVARRQIGCIRFSYVPSDSRTPRRYGCEPDGALLRVDEDIMRLDTPMSVSERAALAAQRKAEARESVVPRFQSIRYGSPAYLRLADYVSGRIRRGAHDESEMGVYHDLFEPQRHSLLSDRLAEFVPASCDAAVVFVS